MGVIAAKDFKKITIGIPAYKAQDYISDALCSVNIQTYRDLIEVVIAPDLPGDSYSFLKKKFPNLSIRILKCTGNTGPGLARQRILDACKTDWIMFMDSDDVLFSAFVVERMYEKAVSSPKCVQVICPFYEEAMRPELKGKYLKKEDVWNPWVFSRLFNMNFIRANKITFSNLRAGEDCEFNWKFQLLIEDDDRFKVYFYDEIAYLWRKGSDNSLTRQNIGDEGIPQFNYDLSCWGVVEATLRVFKYLKSVGKNPTKNYIIAAMAAINKAYICYHLAKAVGPEFVPQQMWFGKYFYHEFYHTIDNMIEIESLEKLLTKGNTELLDSIKNRLKEDMLTMEQFMDHLRNDEYGGIEEFWKIRDTLPEKCRETDEKSGLIKCVPGYEEYKKSKQNNT